MGFRDDPGYDAGYVQALHLELPGWRATIGRYTSGQIQLDVLGEPGAVICQNLMPDDAAAIRDALSLALRGDTDS